MESKKKVLDKATSRKILDLVGGDRKKAEKLAELSGFDF